MDIEPVTIKLARNGKYHHTQRACRQNRKPAAIRSNVILYQCSHFEMNVQSCHANTPRLI